MTDQELQERLAKVRDYFNALSPDRQEAFLDVRIKRIGRFTQVVNAAMEGDALARYDAVIKQHFSLPKSAHLLIIADMLEEAVQRHRDTYPREGYKEANNEIGRLRNWISVSYFETDSLCNEETVELLRKKALEIA